MDITSMQWQPKLMRLTQIGHPDIEGGKPTVCFVQAQAITMIRRTVARFSKVDEPNVFHPTEFATEVFYCHGALHVVETPEEVALQRDRLLGHETKPQSV